MKAIVYGRYGAPDVLRLEEVAKPVPADNEVLIQVRAASVNPYDWHFMRGTPIFLRLFSGLFNPKIPRLGSDVAGEVEAVGRGIQQLKPGDPVFGNCQGSFAEYACAREPRLAKKPRGITFEQAASAGIAGLTALQALRDKGRLQPRQRVLINGAAGGVGTFAVQIAKALGAGVTGICSGKNVEMVRSIGADRVIDYNREDFTKSSERYDLILDCIGNHSLRECIRAMNPKGTYVMVGGKAGRWFSPMDRSIAMQVRSCFVSQQLVGIFAKSCTADLSKLGELMESGKVTPLIDRRYRLSDVPEAVTYVEEGHARGKVVITLEGATST
ncbi:MAG TPA: NAD(P)-dependent alcohol dehydrogenase [Terracidiphilus sp.]|nr:NAD(P)-dependent alcohol dehydrogenase [Terracidiphilus sp.]